MKSKNIKIVTLGDCYVGKTSILKRHIENKYSTDYKYTIGLNFLNKKVVKEDTIYDIYFWDTAGSERFKTINSIFYRGSDACILVFDLTKNITFSNIIFWMDEFLLNTSPERAEDFPFILLGNKSDLTNQWSVPEKFINDLCKNKNIKYFNVSAKTGENLDEAIDYIIQKSIERTNNVNLTNSEFDKISLSDVIDNNDNTNRQKSYCGCN